MKKLFLLLVILLCCNFAFANDYLTKIIGGQKVTDSQKYPWMVALLYNDGRYYYQFCGGTYVGNGWVLTAAHCFYKDNTQVRFAKDIDILYGTLNLSTGRGGLVSSDKVYIHEEFNNTYKFNDIALIKLKRNLPVKSADYITNSQLQYTSPGTMGIVTGWGLTSNGDEAESSMDLLKVSVPIVSESVCKQSYGDLIKSYNICAGYKDGGKDSCSGDSGGPLMVNYNGGYLVAGIVSWGRGCALPDYYGVYTRISRYEDWLNHIFYGLSSSQFKTAVLPDNDMISLTVENGNFDNTLSGESYDLESCVGTIENFDKNMLKLTQEFVTSNDSVDISLIFPEVEDNDSFYLANNAGGHVFANDIINITGDKVVYNIKDNGQFDLNEETGKIKTVITKTNTVYESLKNIRSPNCFYHLTNRDRSMNMPNDTNDFQYSKIKHPFLSVEPGKLKPIGLGDVDNNLLNIRLALPNFKNKVNIYFAIYAPSIVKKIFLLNSENRLVEFNNDLTNLPVWKANVITGIDEQSLFGNINIQSWPSGTYYFMIIAADPQDFSKRYSWLTYFFK